MTKRPKKTKKETLWYSGKRAIHQDHQRHPMEIPFGMVGGLPAMVISFKFHHHRLSGYRAMRGRNLAVLAVLTANSLNLYNSRTPVRP